MTNQAKNTICRALKMLRFALCIFVVALRPSFCFIVPVYAIPNKRLSTRGWLDYTTSATRLLIRTARSRLA